MSEVTPRVGVVVGSPAELAVMQQATAILEKLEIPHEIQVMSPGPRATALTADEVAILVKAAGGTVQGSSAGGMSLGFNAIREFA